MLTMFATSRMLMTRYTLRSLNISSSRLLQEARSSSLRSQWQWQMKKTIMNHTNLLSSYHGTNHHPIMNYSTRGGGWPTEDDGEIKCHTTRYGFYKVSIYQEPGIQGYHFKATLSPVGRVILVVFGLMVACPLLVALVMVAWPLLVALVMLLLAVATPFLVILVPAALIISIGFLSFVVPMGLVAVIYGLFNYLGVVFSMLVTKYIYGIHNGVYQPKHAKRVLQDTILGKWNRKLRVWADKKNP